MTLKDECPDCQSRLVLRRNRQTQQTFIGCSAWPKCKFTSPDPDTYDPDPYAEYDYDVDNFHPGHPSYYGDN